jgi:hypothetical protein
LLGLNWEFEVDMNQKIEALLQVLREAIHEAVAESRDVAQAMAELEHEGRCPAFLVDVMLVDEPRSPQSGTFGETLVLTADDRRFLREIKIASPA